MKNRPEPLDDLIDAINHLPSIGKKTATRIAYHIVNADSRLADDLIEKIRSAKSKLRNCKSCRVLSSSDFCSICSNASRNQRKMCIVSHDEDIISFERASFYGGLYFVIGGEIDPRNPASSESLFIDELWSKIKEGNFEELIIATNPTMQGEITAAFISKALKRNPEFKTKLTKIALGLPMNSSLEYADDITLKKSFENRRDINEQ